MDNQYKNHSAFSEKPASNGPLKAIAKELLLNDRRPRRYNASYNVHNANGTTNNVSTAEKLAEIAVPNQAEQVNIPKQSYENTAIPMAKIEGDLRANNKEVETGNNNPVNIAAARALIDNLPGYIAKKTEDLKEEIQSGVQSAEIFGNQNAEMQDA